MWVVCAWMVRCWKRTWKIRHALHQVVVVGLSQSRKLARIAFVLKRPGSRQDCRVGELCSMHRETLGRCRYRMGLMIHRDRLRCVPLLLWLGVLVVAHIDRWWYCCVDDKSRRWSVWLTSGMHRSMVGLMSLATTSSTLITMPKLDRAVREQT